MTKKNRFVFEFVKKKNYKKSDEIKSELDGFQQSFNNQNRFLSTEFISTIRHINPHPHFGEEEDEGNISLVF